MPPDFFRTIASALDREDLDVILIGGWAVNEHGFHRTTRDIDFAFLSERKSEITRILNGLGFTAFSDSSLVTRLEFRDPYMPIIDILWVDIETHQKMLRGSVSMTNLPSMRVIGLRDLLAMKLHALKQQGERNEKDLLDILTLMKHNPQAPSVDEFAELCQRFGPPGIHEDLQRRWDL